MGQDGEDPISHKKLVLKGEGVWDTHKEILGWIFDGCQKFLSVWENRKFLSALQDFLVFSVFLGFCFIFIFFTIRILLPFHLFFSSTAMFLVAFVHRHLLLSSPGPVDCEGGLK